MQIPNHINDLKWLEVYREPKPYISGFALLKETGLARIMTDHLQKKFQELTEWYQQEKGKEF